MVPVILIAEPTSLTLLGLVVVGLVVLLRHPRTRAMTGWSILVLALLAGFWVLIRMAPVELAAGEGMLAGESWAFFAILLLILVLCAVVAGLAALFRNPRTRPIGWGLLLVVPVAFLSLLFWAFTGTLSVETRKVVKVSTGSTTSVTTDAPPAEHVAAKPKPAARAAQPSTAQPARPAWVDEPPRYVDNAYLTPFRIGPYTSRLECEGKLPAELGEAVTQYVELLLGPEAARRVRLPADELRRQLVRQEWEETVQTSLGPMIVLHLQLAFDAQMQDRIRDAVHEATVRDRLWPLGIGLGSVLVLLAGLFGYLKFTEARTV